VQADLETAGELQPLWYGEGDPALMDVARKPWLYRKRFRVPDEFAGKRMQLVFDGVDHACEVRLDGELLGRHSGMFRQFDFEVSEALRPGTEHLLEVHIDPMPESLLPFLKAADSRKSGFFTEDHFFVRGIDHMRQVLKDLKSPTALAWDWGVALYSLGIWKEVRLEASGSARIDGLQVKTGLDDTFQTAGIEGILEVHSMTERPVLARFRVSGHGPERIVERGVELKAGRQRVAAQLTLKNPALWWPAGHGEQPLYQLEAQLLDPETRQVLHRRTSRFGIRKIEWAQVEGAPADFIVPYQLRINGRIIRAIGSNLTPPDLLFGRAASKYEMLVRHALAANFNYLRIWGGGVILHPEFYERCDEAGLILQVEIPLANCRPEEDAEFLDHLEKTSRSIFRQVRNHPSIIQWTGGNEMRWKEKDSHPALDLLRRVAREEDGTRRFLPTDPVEGGHHAPWTFVPETHYAHYDQFDQYWYGEFGTQTPAHHETWLRDVPEENRWPIDGVDDPVLIRKNAVEAVFNDDMWLGKDTIEAFFGAARSLEELLRAGQFLGAESLRYAFGALRRQGKSIGGFSSWCFSESWPNLAGSYMVDHYGRPLMNFHFVREVQSPLALSLKYDSLLYDPQQGVEAELWLVSDAPNPQNNLRWQWTARDRMGTVIGRESGITRVDYLEVKQLGSLAVKPPSETEYGPVFVELRLDTSEGHCLNQQMFIFGRNDVADPFAPLLAEATADASPDDSSQPVPAPKPVVENPANPDNLALAANGARPATALNDGKLGLEHGWFGEKPEDCFEIELAKTAEIGRFRLGRVPMPDSYQWGLNHLKIETSMDGESWQTVFQRKGVEWMIGFRAWLTLEIHIPPVRARFVRGTVAPKLPRYELACIDEFEVYAPDP
jgi:beta-mannosidase